MFVLILYEFQNNFNSGYDHFYAYYIYYFILKLNIFQICVYCVTFVMVLGGAAFSKFGLLVMTPRLNGNAVVTHCGNSTPATSELFSIISIINPTVGKEF